MSFKFGLNVSRRSTDLMSSGRAFHKVGALWENALYVLRLGYLKDSNAATHFVDNDIFYLVIDLSTRSKSYIITFIS